MKKKKRVLEYFGMTDDQFVHVAFRYYLGRMTIATTCFARGLANAWPDLQLSIRRMIADELEKEFELDDRARARGEKKTALPLGMDCDRAAWEEVRKLYRSET